MLYAVNVLVIQFCDVRCNCGVVPHSADWFQRIHLDQLAIPDLEVEVKTQTVLSIYYREHFPRHRRVFSVHQVFFPLWVLFVAFCVCDMFAFWYSMCTMTLNLLCWLRGAVLGSMRRETSLPTLQPSTPFPHLPSSFLAPLASIHLHDCVTSLTASFWRSLAAQPEQNM